MLQLAIWFALDPRPIAHPGNGPRQLGQVGRSSPCKLLARLQGGSTKPLTNTPHINDDTDTRGTALHRTAQEHCLPWPCMASRPVHVWAPQEYQQRKMWMRLIAQRCQPRRHTWRRGHRHTWRRGHRQASLATSVFPSSMDESPSSASNSELSSPSGEAGTSSAGSATSAPATR